LLMMGGGVPPHYDTIAFSSSSATSLLFTS
jgi:hypothetical protein